MKKEYQIYPVAKPRMVRSDKWKKRPATEKYWKFVDQCKFSKMVLPVADAHIIFVLEMPSSWSKKKKMEFEGKPHRQKPDLDNLIKAIGDALYKNDSLIWDLRATKIWGVEGKIIIEDLGGI